MENMFDKYQNELKKLKRLRKEYEETKYKVSINLIINSFLFNASSWQFANFYKIRLLCSK